jgi:2-dehydropantoate 2-reductase
MTRVCVAGVGVIGSLFAAHLARVGEVSAVTRREEHARALREQGLRVSGRADFVARLDASTDPDRLATPDLVIVACKGTELESLMERLAGHWPDATVMTVQNGIGADEVAARFGDWKLLTSVTFMSGTRHADTHVQYVLDTATWIGPARGTTPADARAVAELIASSGLKAEAFDDLRPSQWSKLIFNATVNGVAALTGLPHDFHFSDTEHFGELVHELMAEGKRVAAAGEVELHDDPWEMNVHATKHGSSHYPSMLEDVEAGRPTEIGLINGALVREAERLGVEAPLQAALYALVTGREAAYS